VSSGMLNRTQLNSAPSNNVCWW